VQRFHADVSHIGAADALHREFMATGQHLQQQCQLSD
jgi:hypothetical protein